jgi:hypothetical protein
MGISFLQSLGPGPQRGGPIKHIGYFAARAVPAARFDYLLPGTFPDLLTGENA